MKLQITALAGLLAFAGCAPTETVRTQGDALPTTAVRGEIQRQELACILVRFLIDRQPAEQQGYDVQNAIAKLTDDLNFYGIELSIPNQLVDRYQNQTINVPSPVHNEQSETGTVAELETSVAESFRAAFEENLSELGPGVADLPPCDWFITGQVDVSEPRQDLQSDGLVADVSTRLAVVQLQDNKLVGSASRNGIADGVSERAVIAEALDQSLESVAANIAQDVRDAASNYTISVEGLDSYQLELFEALTEAGFSPGNPTSTSNGFRLNAVNPADSLTIQGGLRTIRDRLRAVAPDTQVQLSGTLISIKASP